MADERLKQKIYGTLKRGTFQGPDDAVYVSDGDGENIHVVVVSPQFHGRRMKEKEDLIWSELAHHLAQEEWTKVSLSIGVAPEELKTL